MKKSLTTITGILFFISLIGQINAERFFFRDSTERAFRETLSSYANLFTSNKNDSLFSILKKNKNIVSIDTLNKYFSLYESRYSYNGIGASEDPVKKKEFQNDSVSVLECYFFGPEILKTIHYKQTSQGSVKVEAAACNALLMKIFFRNTNGNCEVSMITFEIVTAPDKFVAWVLGIKSIETSPTAPTIIKKN